MQANFGAAADIAKSGEVVTITQYGRPTLMLLSYKEGEPELSLDDINRPKFDRYFTDKAFGRTDSLASYEAASVLAEVTEVSTDCTDPKDNIFLSLALSVSADCIVSGDKAHLILMHPHRGIDILSVGDFLLRVHLPRLLSS